MFPLHSCQLSLWLNMLYHIIIFNVYWAQHVPNRTLPHHPPKFWTPILPVLFVPIVAKIRWLKPQPSPPPWRALLKTSLTWIPMPPTPPQRQPNSHPCLVLIIHPRCFTFPPDPGRLPTPMPAHHFPNHGTKIQNLPIIHLQLPHSRKQGEMERLRASRHTLHHHCRQWQSWHPQ